MSFLGAEPREDVLRLNAVGHFEITDMATGSPPNLAQAPWVTLEADGVCLALHCQPGARQTRICGLHGDRLKIALAAPAVDNQANQFLVRWLADQFGITKDRVTLLSGQTSRQKRVRLGGVSLDQVVQLLGDNEGLPTKGSI